MPNLPAWVPIATRGDAIGTESTIRFGIPGDALCIALLSMQVFLDTYATEGVRPDLAQEALDEYSPSQFEKRLSDANRLFILAEAGKGLLGYAEINTKPSSLPIHNAAQIGMELVRLYVQPAAQNKGLGQQLLHQSELACKIRGCDCLWLTAWSGNTRALSFYRKHGLADLGATTCSFQGNSYENRVLVKAPGLANTG